MYAVCTFENECNFLPISPKKIPLHKNLISCHFSIKCMAYGLYVIIYFTFSYSYFSQFLSFVFMLLMRTPIFLINFTLLLPRQTKNTTGVMHKEINNLRKKLVYDVFSLMVKAFSIHNE